MMDTLGRAVAPVQALRVAAAATIAFIVSEWWHLPYTDLAAWTTHMVM